MRTHHRLRPQKAQEFLEDLLHHLNQMEDDRDFQIGDTVSYTLQATLGPDGMWVDDNPRAETLP